MKVKNNGEEIRFGNFLIQSGINFLSTDFSAIIDKDPKLKKQWKKLLDKGVIVIL